MREMTEDYKDSFFYDRIRERWNGIRGAEVTNSGGRVSPKSDEAAGESLSRVACYDKNVGTLS